MYSTNHMKDTKEKETTDLESISSKLGRIEDKIDHLKKEQKDDKDSKDIGDFIWIVVAVVVVGYLFFTGGFAAVFEGIKSFLF